MKKFLNEYFHLRQELRALKHNQYKIRMEMYNKAYKDIINSNYYDKYKKCEEIIEYVKSTLEFEEATKNHLLHKNNSIKYLTDILNIYKDEKYMVVEDVKMLKEKGNKKEVIK